MLGLLDFLGSLNNYWTMFIAFILIIFIIKKIYYLNKPFDEERFIAQYVNQEKISKNLNLNIIPESLPKLVNYWVGLE
jgi:hypothetical protein